MDWFSFFLNGSLIAAMGILKLLFAARFTGKSIKMWHMPLYIGLLYAGDFAAAKAGSEWLAHGLDLLFLYVGNRYLLKSCNSASLTASVLAVYVSQLSFGILNPIEMLLFPKFLGNPWVLYLVVTLASLAGVLLCACCYVLILKQVSGVEGDMEPFMWLMLPPGLFFAAVEFYILHTAYGQALEVPSAPRTGTQLSLLALQMIGLGALFCTLCAYKRVCDGMKVKAAIASLTQEVKTQKTYVAEAGMRYEKTKSFRHDLKNHLSVLAGFLKDHDAARALAYLQKLDIAAEELNFTVYTGNPVVDILLRDKLGYAKEKGILTEVSLTLPKPCQTMDDLDLCVIFANALDNAVRACGGAADPRLIRVTGERQGDFYMLVFENSCAPGPFLEAGTGLSNIKTAVEKYGGTMTAERTEDSFCLSVLINISVHSGDIPGHKY